LVKSRTFGLHSLNKESPQNFALVPLADMLNHNSGGGNVKPAYDLASGDFSVIAQVPIKAGAAVEWNYGEKSNPDLFQRYGFTDPSLHVFSEFGLFLNITDFAREDGALSARKNARLDSVRGVSMNDDGTVFTKLSLEMDSPGMRNVLSLLRFRAADAKRLTACEKKATESPGCPPIDATLERKSLAELKALLQNRLDAYGGSAADDETLLAGTLSWQEKQAITVRLGEKTVLKGLWNVMNYADPLFDYNPTALNRELDKRFSGSSGITSYVRKTLARVVLEETLRWAKKHNAASSDKKSEL